MAATLAERQRQHGDGGGSVAAASEARWQHQQIGRSSAVAKRRWRAVLWRRRQRKTAVAGTKTTAGTAMVGYTVDNQLKGAVEELTAAATVTAAETATATEMVMVTARIRTAMPMSKGFLVGSTSSSLEPAKWIVRDVAESLLSD
jgi:hypothetical protein